MRRSWNKDEVELGAPDVGVTRLGPLNPPAGPLEGTPRARARDDDYTQKIVSRNQQSKLQRGRPQCNRALALDRLSAPTRVRARENSIVLISTGVAVVSECVLGPPHTQPLSVAFVVEFAAVEFSVSSSSVAADALCTKAYTVKPNAAPKMKRYMTLFN